MEEETPNFAKEMKHETKRNGPRSMCASIELWTHLGSLESTRKAWEAPGFALCHSNASLVLLELASFFAASSFVSPFSTDWNAELRRLARRPNII